MVKIDLMTLLVMFVVIGLTMTMLFGLSVQSTDGRAAPTLNQASQALLGQEKVIVSDYYKDGYYERLANMPDPKVHAP